MSDSISPNRFSFYDLDGKAKKDDKGVEMAPLTGERQQSQAKQPSYNIKVREDSNLNMMLGNTPAPDCSTFCAFVFAYVTYTCQYAPRLCWTLAVIALFIPSYLLLMGVIFNPTEHFGVIEHDFTNVQSQYDFTLKDIDHWCIKGDNDSCQCEDPLQPEPRSEFRAWSKSHIGNVQQIADLMENDLANPDIAFLGGSIVEKMDGKWFGNKTDNRLQNLAKIFNQHFTNLEGEATGDNSLTAISLGVAGDTNPAVLYRLLNGEMPDDFNPKIWWLELGMSDLGRSQCSEELVVLGILRVVEEIVNQKPDTNVVINSMFPMIELREKLDPNDMDTGLDESFGEKPKKNNNNNNGNKGDKIRGLRHINHDLPLATKDDSVDRFPVSSNGRFLQKETAKMNGDKKTQKKFNPVTHKENKLPLWTSIMAINKELAKFAEKHEKVFFFDVTRLFTEQEGKFYNLNLKLITPTGIPTESGFGLWEEAVVTKAREILSGHE